MSSSSMYFRTRITVVSSTYGEYSVSLTSTVRLLLSADQTHLDTPTKH